MRVVSINAWSGGLVRGPLHAESIEPEGHKQRRVEALVAGLRELEPDVVLMQECVPEPDFSRGIADALGYDHTHRIVNVGVRLGRLRIPNDIGEGHGLAVLARPEFQLRSKGALRLSGTGVRSRLFGLHVTPIYDAFAARVQLGDRSVVIVNAHTRYWFLDTPQLERAWEALRDAGRVRGSVPWLLRGLHLWQTGVRQLELGRLARWVVKLSRNDTPVVLGADLNLDPQTTPVARLARRAGLTNALPSRAPQLRTWEPELNANIPFSTRDQWADGSSKSPMHQLIAFYDGQPQCPDHVLCTRQLAIEDAGLALDRAHEGVFASDHFGIRVDLSLSQPSP